MKNIEFVLNLQGDTMMALCNIFEIPVTVHEDNQVLISLMVSVQMWSCTNYITIKYHHFRNFVANGDIKIQHIDTEENIVDIFTKPLYYEFSEYLHYKHNIWYIKGPFFTSESEITRTKRVS